MFEPIEEKYSEGVMMVKSDENEIPMHAMTQEDINAWLADGYEVVDYCNPEHEKNQALEVILTNQYMNIYGDVTEYTIGGYQGADEVQQNLMRRMKGSFVS